MEQLNEQELIKLRRTKWAGSRLLYFPVIDSTNTKAMQLGDEGYPHGTLIFADKQAAGRGRRGKTWESAEGEGIFMSLLLRPEIKTENASMLTLVAALAVSSAVQKVTGFTTEIKWPNDIVMQGKKVCGILTEMRVQQEQFHVVIGIGMNVCNTSFPEEIRDVATSLFLEMGEYYSRAAIMEIILEFFEEYYEIFCKTQDLSGLQKAYEERLVNRGKEVRVLDLKAPFSGVAKGITKRGELIVDEADMRHIVSAGEVSVRGMYGYV